MFRYAEGACGVDSEALHKLELVNSEGLSSNDLLSNTSFCSSYASCFLHLFNSTALFFGGCTDSAGKARQGRAIRALSGMYMRGT